ncbi:hypothetical protein DV736_g5846, partial [Chaetothyriales sp. CBS 134916]
MHSRGMLAAVYRQTSRAGIPGSSGGAQPRDSNAPAENSWAQAMGSRPSAPLDLSSSSAFPSLSSGSQTSSLNPGSSAWQTGPPQSDSTRRQVLGGGRMHTAARQQPVQTADSFLSSDAFSRNQQSEFSMQDTSSQASRRNVVPPGPPGLLQRPPDGDDDSADLSGVTSPAALAQHSRSPLVQTINGAFGPDRPHGDESRRAEFGAQSSSDSHLARDPFSGREAFDQTSERTADNVLSGLSDRDKWGLKGYLALTEGPNLAFRSLTKGQDLAAHGLNMNSDQPLLPTYTGPFAAPNSHPLRPLDTEYSIPDCYTVKKVAPLHTRINSFSDETLFYIFYSMPRDFMQVLVAQELMERKWRYHMREQMWMMRDESASTYIYSDDRTSEHGYYIWWDKNVWKKVRRAFTLRYEDLDDVPNVGNRRAQLAALGVGTTGASAAAAVNGGGAAAMFNAVPGLEKLAARGF